MAGGNSIPVFHPNHGGGTTGGSGGGSSNGGGGGTGGSGTGGTGGGGGGGKTPNPYAYAQAQERKADNEAYRKYMDQAHTIGLQIKALRLALGKQGFIQALDQRLKNIGLVQRQSEADLVTGYRERVGSLEQTSRDNEKAAGAQGYANLANRSRERSNAVGEAAAQGAGESDTLRAQGAALRNWNANQNEVNRSFYDTKSSIESSLTDLTVDTRTARINNALQANADRDSVWTNYYDQRSETLTALGNTLGQQAEYYGLAQEAKNGKKVKKLKKGASQASGQAFHQASLVAGQAWENPGVSKGLRQWAGADPFESDLNNDRFASAPTELAKKKPEGATLRSW
jgi:hypothetical protein